MQAVLIILGIVVGGAIVGLLVGYAILRLQKRSWPYGWPGSKKGHPEADQGGASAGMPGAAVPQGGGGASGQPGRSSAKAAGNINPGQTRTSERKTGRGKSALMAEIEANLALATAKFSGKLTPFRTEALDANPSRASGLPTELREELTEAYTDMHLINTLVTLSKQGGHSSDDVKESYLKLRTRVAERLRKISPEISRADF